MKTAALPVARSVLGSPRRCLLAFAGLAGCLALGLTATPAAAQPPLCTAGALTAAYSAPHSGVSGGQFYYTLTVFNSSTAACSLAGPPAMTLLGKHGASLPTHVISSPDTSYAIVLEPNQWAATQTNFTANTTNPPCEAAAHSVRLTFPGTAAIVAPMDPASVCDGGTINLTPLIVVPVTPPCTWSDLTGTFKALGLPATSGKVKYALQLTGTGPDCYVIGTPGLRLRSATGHPLPTALSGPVSFPDQMGGMGIGATLDATAYVGRPRIVINRHLEECAPFATKLRVTLKPSGSTAIIPISPAARFCRGGELKVSGFFTYG
jgi:hypothetical protein